MRFAWVCNRPAVSTITTSGRVRDRPRPRRRRPRRIGARIRPRTPLRRGRPRSRAAPPRRRGTCPQPRRAPCARAPRASRELADGRRLAGSVDADHEDDGRAVACSGQHRRRRRKGPRPPRRARPRGRRRPAAPRGAVRARRLPGPRRRHGAARPRAAPRRPPATGRTKHRAPRQGAPALAERLAQAGEEAAALRVFPLRPPRRHPAARPTSATSRAERYDQPRNGALLEPEPCRTARRTVGPRELPRSRARQAVAAARSSRGRRRETICETPSPPIVTP